MYLETYLFGYFIGKKNVWLGYFMRKKPRFNYCVFVTRLCEPAVKIFYNSNRYLNVKYVKKLVVKIINPFLTNAPLLCPLKTIGVEHWLKMD